MATVPRSTRSSDPRTRRSRKFLARLLKSKYIVIGISVTTLLIAFALVGPLIRRVDPEAMDFVAILQPPSGGHPFGTDDFGRDVLARVMYGARISLFVGGVVSLITLISGLLIGVTAAFYQALDDVLMRVMDVLMAFPSILLAIGILAILGPRLSNIVIALSIVYTPRSARVVRGIVLSLKRETFVDAATALGAKDARILAVHIVPNVVPPLLIQQTFIFATAVLAEAALSFLGVGVPPEVPTLGGILSDSRTHLRAAPWMSFAPGIAISVLVLGVNMIGDGLRDVLDPRMKL